VLDVGSGRRRGGRAEGDQQTERKAIKDHSGLAESLAELFLMTAHQAKGKEFDAIVVVPLDARRWPDDDDHRRLLYVGLTRATQSWTLIAPITDASPMLALLP